MKDAAAFVAYAVVALCVAANVGVRGVGDTVDCEAAYLDALVVRVDHQVASDAMEVVQAAFVVMEEVHHAS